MSRMGDRGMLLQVQRGGSARRWWTSAVPAKGFEPDDVIVGTTDPDHPTSRSASRR